MSQLNPITQTYQAIRKVFTDSESLMALIKPANFPDMSATNFEDFRDNTPAGVQDFKEIRLMQGQFLMLPHGRNSLVGTINHSFPIIVTHASLKLIPVNQLKYAMFQALAKAPSDLGLSFLSMWDMSGGSDDFSSRSPLARGVKRAITIAQINVQLNIPRANLLAT
jgi:hypothetical protein